MKNSTLYVTVHCALSITVSKGVVEFRVLDQTEAKSIMVFPTPRIVTHRSAPIVM